MDRITLDVIGAGLLAIAEEMGEALIKSSYSTNIKERQDCSTALFNVQGEVIAQAEHIPMHLGSLIMIIHETLRRYPLDALRDHISRVVETFHLSEAEGRYLQTAERGQCLVVTGAGEHVAMQTVASRSRPTGSRKRCWFPINSACSATFSASANCSKRARN